MFGMIAAGGFALASSFSASSDEMEQAINDAETYGKNKAAIAFSRRRQVADISREFLTAVDNSALDKQEIDSTAKVVKSNISTEAALTGTIGGSVNMSLDDVDTNALRAKVNVDKQLQQQHKQLSENLIDVQLDAESKQGEFKTDMRSGTNRAIDLATSFMGGLNTFT